jgi:antitoxin MazE
MIVSVRKWGNSASIRIPAVLMQAAMLRFDQELDMREEAGRLILEPVRQTAYDLTALVAGITPDNCHREMDFGAPVGNEVW